MKKLLLGLGSITVITAPIVAVVSCGDEEVGKSTKTIEVMANYAVGQNSAKLQVLVDGFNDKKSKENYKKIMEAISVSGGSEFYAGRTSATWVLSLMGDELMVSYSMVMNGKEGTINMKYTIGAPPSLTVTADDADLASLKSTFGLGSRTLTEEEMKDLRGVTIIQTLSKTASPDNGHNGSSSTGTKMYVLKGKPLLAVSPSGGTWQMSQGLLSAYGGIPLSPEATSLLFVDKKGKIEFFKLFKKSDGEFIASVNTIWEKSLT